MDAAKRELSQYESPVISLVTWMEVLVGAGGAEDFPASHPSVRVPYRLR